MQPFLKFVLVVLLAHLLADFPLQTSKVAQGKSRGTRAFLVHGCVHLLVLIACLTVFVGPSLLGSVRFWTAAVVYIVAHVAIDRAKQSLVSTKKMKDSAAVFLVDQALHFGTILLLTWLLIRPSWSSVLSQLTWSPETREKILEAGVVYAAVVFAGGYLIRYLTRDLAAGIERPKETAEQVKNAGMYIGWLERFLVVTAILVQSPSLVGLIMTGKSIARFPELKDRFVEYFLIGTLLSLSVAVIGGLVLAKMCYGTISLK
jgi:hypothetical protein